VPPTTPNFNQGPTPPSRPPQSCWLLSRFILTGPAVGADNLLETSVPGVFAVGDVRSGSTKRCATAVGEGAWAVRLVHAHLEAHPAKL
jgi:thioredoxin reductase